MPTCCGRRCASRSVSSSPQSDEHYERKVIDALADRGSLYDAGLSGTDVYLHPRHHIRFAGATLPPMKSGRRVSPPQGESVTKHVFNYEENRWTSHQTRVQFEEKPFAEGEMRVCFRLKDLGMPSGAQDHVAKMMVKGKENISTYFLDAGLQVMAGALTKQFNALHLSKWKLSFLESSVFEFTDRVHPTTKGPVFMSVEPYMVGKLRHIVVGNSECIFCGTHRDVHDSYSIGPVSTHFTHHVSGGSLVVTDLQAFERGDELVLTDPRVGSNKYDIWGGGPKRMRSFFRMHKCNHFCKQLMLPGLHDLRIVGKKPLETPDQHIVDRIVESTANTLRDVVGKQALADLSAVYLQVAEP